MLISFYNLFISNNNLKMAKQVENMKKILHERLDCHTLIDKLTIDDLYIHKKYYNTNKRLHNKPFKLVEYKFWAYDTDCVGSTIYFNSNYIEKIEYVQPTLFTITSLIQLYEYIFYTFIFHKDLKPMSHCFIIKKHYYS